MATPKLNLPEIIQSQAAKYITHNEALRIIDALSTGVKSKSVAAEPSSPAEGDAYILPVGKTGTNWGAMADNSITVYANGKWWEITAKEGFCCWVADENNLSIFDGAAWTAPYAKLDSPAFTGIPTAPTAAEGTNTTQIATTAFVEIATEPAQLLEDIKSVDGSGSGLDADLLDGMNSDSLNTANTIVARDGSGNFSAGIVSVTKLDASETIKTGGYTVATLPAGDIGMRVYVTDANSPVWGAPVSGGGTSVVPVFYNGSTWICA